MSWGYVEIGDGDETGDRQIVRGTVNVVEIVGAYTADRAAALSGVPRSTIHWWARNEVLVPTVSATRTMLWSYADLMGLRVIYWLRQRKTSTRGADIPRTSMRAVRRALEQLREFDLGLWERDRQTILVDSRGSIVLRRDSVAQDLEGQTVSDLLLDLTAPFSTREGTRGPDLVCPRSQLRIVPGRLSGSPHVVGTRLETRAIAALATDGYDAQSIQRFYPYVTAPQLEQALDLEAQLSHNLSLRAA